MSTFSLPMSSLDDSINDAMIIAGGAGIDTITINTGSNYYYTGAGVGGSSNTITISNGGTGSSGFTIGGAGNTVILDDISTSFNWKSEEFVNCMPDYDRIQKMCKEYPGLAIAFEKFKTVYSLVKDHYDTPEDKRPKP
jgi:hypothetical protein